DTSNVARAELYDPALPRPAEVPPPSPTRDFNKDGKADILWRDTSGNVSMWVMDGTTVTNNSVIANIWTTWSIVGVGDFNGDGKADILWRDTSGYVAVWLMD